MGSVELSTVGDRAWQRTAMGIADLLVGIVGGGVQMRSLVVDLLELVGLSYSEASSLVPPRL